MYNEKRHNKVSLVLMALMFGSLLALAIMGNKYTPKVQADVQGNHRIYLTGHTDFLNESTTVEIYHDGKTGADFACFRHDQYANDTLSCSQIDPSKVIKP